MSFPYTADGLKEFIQFLSDKGLLNPNTAGGMRTASEKVLSALDENERQNIKGLDVETALRRFQNKNPGAIKPDSARVYQSRLGRALQLLDEFNLNPTGFKVKSIGKGKVTENGIPAKKKQEPRKGQTTYDSMGGNPPNTAEIQNAVVRTQSVSLMFPLRGDFNAQFVIPKNLTMREAKKLAAYFELLAVDADEK